MDWQGKMGEALTLTVQIIMMILRGYLVVLSTYHVISGGISYLAPARAMAFYKSMYAVDPIERRHLFIILRPWGALSITVGMVGWFAAVDPIRYWGVVLAILVLLILRVIYRIGLRNELAQISQIPQHRNRLSIAIILVGVFILSIGLWAIMFLPMGE
jgi:hypothetical protein